MNPRRATRCVDLLTWIHPANTLLLAPTPTVSPFIANEYANPVHSRTNPALLTWSHSSNALYFVPAPFVPPSFPNPIARRPRFQGFDQTNENLLSPPVVLVPFVPFEFRNPTARRRQSYSFEQTNTGLLNPPILVAPFVPCDFPNPTRRRTAPLGWTARSNEVLYVVGPTPFAQLSWPNPPLAKRRIPLDLPTRGCVDTPPVTVIDVVCVAAFAIEPTYIGLTELQPTVFSTYGIEPKLAGEKDV